MGELINESAFDQLEQEMVENQDLSRAVESLKKDIEGEIDQDKTVGQYNLERELDSRERTIESAFSSALAQADSVQSDFSDLDDRTDEDEFQKHMRRDAVDAEDMEEALNIIDQYQQLVSRLVLVLKIYRDDRQLLRSGIDIQQQRANESQVMEMLKDTVEAQQNKFESMGKQMADEFADRVDAMIEDKNEASENQQELVEQMQGLAEDLKEVRETPIQVVHEPEPYPDGSGDTDSHSTGSDSQEAGSGEDSEAGGESSSNEEHPDLTSTQEELYELVEENPEKDLEWYADQMDQKPRMLKMWRTKIQRTEGYENFSLE